MTNNKMIRDAYGDVVPQTLNDDGSYTVLSNGNTSGIDFSKYKLLRDALGNPLPSQYFDADQRKFVAGSIGGIGGGGKGEKGDDGKSAYEIALEQGFVGTEAQWLASLKGERGETGQAGSNANVTSASITSALGFAPASNTTTNAHINDKNIHVTGDDKYELYQLISRKFGSYISTPTYATPPKMPLYYYVDAPMTIWEHWNGRKIGLPTSDDNLWSTVCTIVPYDSAVEKIVQMAYSTIGIYTRHSIGDDEQTAEWSNWIRLLDDASVTTTVRDLTARITVIESRLDAIGGNMANGETGDAT